MSQAYGLKAIIPTDAPHILGIASARTGASDLLLDIWNGSTSAARVLAVQKDGYVWLPDGAAATPAIAFYSDPDTGLFKRGANQLGFAVGGAEHAYLDANGLSWGGGSQVPSSGNVSVSGHTHTESDISDLGTYLTEAAADALYSALGHTHTESDISDLGTYLTVAAAATTYAALVGAEFTGDVQVTKAAPALVLEESDQTAPAGQWRIRAETQQLLIERATSADFGAVSAVITLHPTLGAIFGEAGQEVGFYGSAGTTKATVTGSRGGNAALASLLTALAGLNLITDSSS